MTTKTKVLIEWYDSDGNLTVLDDWVRLHVSKGEEANVNNATITLKNGTSFRGSDGLLYSKYVNPLTGFIRFKQQDTIKIYAARVSDDRPLNTGSDSSDLLMSAEIKEFSVSTGSKSSKIQLECVDKTYVLLNALWSNLYQEDGSVNTSPLIIQNIIRWATNIGQSGRKGFDDEGRFVTNGLYGVDARLVSEGGFIEDTRLDGSGFPFVTIGRSFKAVYEWVDELSTKEFTNNFEGGEEDENNPVQDRTMKYFLDEQNRFHWYYPKDIATSTLTTSISKTGTVSSIDLLNANSFDDSGVVQVGSEFFDYTGKSGNSLTGVSRSVDNTDSESHAVGDLVVSGINIIEGDDSTGHQVIGSSLKKAVFDVVNTVIFNAGDDMNGSGILDFFYDKSSENPEPKMVYKAWTNIARDLKRQELDFASERGLTTITHIQGDEYTFPNNYSDYGGSGELPHWNPGDESITNDSSFNDAVRLRCRAEGINKSKEFVKQRSGARYKGSVSLRFRRYPPGRLIRYTSGLSGLRNVSLRIKTVQYNFNESSSHVSLRVEEDERREGE